MNLTKNFTIDELIASTTADRLGIDNTPTSSDIYYQLAQLATNVLQPLRDLWGKPIVVNSGYRCDALNDAVGGSTHSQHLFGMAADITTGSVDGNRKLFELLMKSSIPFDQAIDEYEYKWVHISYNPNREKQRFQILHLK